MIFLSAGVKTQELDFSTYVGQVSTSIVGMVGGASKGEIGKPILCTTPSGFVEQFGEPLPEDYGIISALMFLKQGNQLYYIREATSSAKEASYTHDNKIKVTFLGKGTYGNNISITITDTTATTFTLSVFVKGLVVEAFTCSLDPLSDNFAEDISSSYIEIEVLEAASSEGNTSTEQGTTEGESGTTNDNLDGEVQVNEVVTPVLTELTEQTYLSGGDNGLPLTKTEIVGSGVRGLQAFSNPDDLDINILCAPGHSDAVTVNTLIEIAESRYDCISLIDPPQGISVQDVLAYHNGTLEGEDYPKKALNSSYAALYYPWVKINNIYSGKDVWVPPSGLICGVYAYNDREGQPWFAPAGLNRGNVLPALDIERNLSEGDRDALYGNGNAVNPIINYKKQGIVVWGQRTLQRKSSATDRVNVRRLMLIIRKAIAISTAYSVFEQIDPITWRCWKGTIEPYLESVKNSRGLYDYKVVMDETTCTQYYIDRNEMPGMVYVKPTKTAEFIPISFVLTSSGASFDE